MTTYALAPATPTTTQREDLAAMLAANELRAYRVRSNGTMRHVSLYPLGSTMRETAEWISDAVEMDGRSVASVATEMHAGTATVRRYLEGLELTEEIEAGEWDGIWDAYASETVELEDDNPPDVRAEVTVEPARVAGDACEPEGTPADELEDALARSLADTVAAGPATQVRANDLHLHLDRKPRSH